MTITAIRYKENTLNDYWKFGLIVEESDILIGENGEVLKEPVYDFQRLNNYLCLNLTALSNHIKQAQ